MTSCKEAEISLVGCVVLDAGYTFARCPEVRASDFETPELRGIYAVALTYWQTGKATDVVTLLHGVGGDEKHKVILVRCAEAVPTAKHCREYAAIVRENGKRRAIARLCAQLLEESKKESLSGCQKKIDELSAELNETPGETVFSTGDGAKAVLEEMGNPPKYIPTGFYRLDRWVQMEHGDYVVVGGRPSAGKTAFTLQMAMRMAKEEPVCYFSMETSPQKLMRRMLSSFGEIPLESMKNGEAKAAVEKVAKPFGDLKLFTVSSSGWNVARIRAMAAQLKTKIIFIDYLSLVQSTGSSRYEKTTEISLALHVLAQQTKTLVVALSQLSRGGKNDPDMETLRESGQIEQDADAVLILHQPDPKSPDRKLRVAKNKEGLSGDMTLRFRGEIQRFECLEGNL